MEEKYTELEEKIKKLENDFLKFKSDTQGLISQIIDKQKDL
ncbi:hypothetical protein [Leuconostoc mesenteroides]|nr:hypothetical protein [Leuconostoc mesenteroides]